MAWPGAEISIKALAEGSNIYPEAIGGIALLGAREPLKWNRDSSGLKVTLPSRKPCDNAVVLKITKKD